MIRVWPFCPRTPTLESLRWVTDVFQAKAGEQRIALRVQPERTFSFAHVLTDEQTNFARVLVRNAQADGGFYVPDWTQAENVGDISAGLEVTLPVDLSTSAYGDKALIWESPYRHEVVDVIEDSTGFLEADVIESYTKAKVMPLFPGEAPEGITVGRLGKSLNDVQIAFILTETQDIAATSYPQYRGHDVMTDCPITGGATFEESTGFELSTFDNVVGNDSYIRARDLIAHRFQMRWHKFTRSDVYELRQWLHSRKGRQKAFWLSSYAKDLTPAQAISGTTITVYNDVLARPAPYDIEIVGINTHRVQVTSTAAGSTVNGRPTVDLTIDSSVTEGLDNIQRVSYLMCLRFDADRVELEHNAAGGTVVSMPCREIPVP
jgi:hypothetical protein